MPHEPDLESLDTIAVPWREIHAPVGPSAEIERDANQGIVHWERNARVTSDAATLAECRIDAAADGDADVFDDVMPYRIERARLDIEIEPTVKTQLRKKMIEDRQSRLLRSACLLIEAHLDANAGLRSRSLDDEATHWRAASR